MPKRKLLQVGDETFGRRLARLRQAAGFTQRELAVELDTSQRMIAYYESQSDHPPTHILPLLAQVLGVTADELLGLRAVRSHKVLGSQRIERRVRKITELPTREKKQLLTIIDTFLEKDRLTRGGSHASTERAGRLS